ncbi:excisionase family DNA-binding protein [Agreia pratensis]|uniref:helix-turn-helix domain-containing protein n=1 Tax=Agreia pratensis TaxID=150121 RepID=UPI00188CEBF7|nr:helix-turn-helix domain-containing protein [Agreia pratensis]MBF4636208.1 excisionase family DNA-binding protein [Agreia pratensis]
MNATLLTHSGAVTEQVLFDEKVQEEAREVIAEAHDRKPIGIAIELEDGSTISLPNELSRALVFAIQGMTQGNVTMRAMPEELTTSTAAGILGVSRPTLMKLISEGEMQATKVGSHHRLNVHDVLALRDRREQARKVAFDELRQIDADLDLN